MALTKIDDRGLKTPIDLLDNEKIRLGTGNDLEIFHNGTDNLIDAVNGNTRLRVNDGEDSIKCIANGAVELYNDNIKRFETHSEGTYHYGHSTFIIGDEGESAQLFLHADDGDDNADKWKLVASAGGPFYLQNYTSGSWESNLIAYGNGAVELYHDNSKKLETNSTGVHVTGMVTCTTEFRCDDNEKFVAGTGQDLQIYHDGTDSIISHQGGTSGDLILQTTGSDDDVFIKCNDDFIVNVQGGAENAIIARNNGAVELYHDASKKLETTANGVSVDGGLTNTGSTTQPLTFKNNSRTGTYNQSCMYAHQNANANSTSNGIVFEVGRLSDSSSAEVGSFVVATRGGQISALIDPNGIQFNGDKAAANGLNDYEQGTFSPTWNTGSASSAMFDSCVYQDTAGHYTKIGNMVFFTVRIETSSVTNANSGSHVILTSLPFTSNSTSGTQSGATFNYAQAVCSSNNGYLPTMHVPSNNTNLNFYTCHGNNYTVGDGNNNFGQTLHIHGQYPTG